LNEELFHDLKDAKKKIEKWRGNLTGVAEILVGLGLLFAKTRKLAAWALIELLIAIFPSNIYMFTDKVAVNGHTFPPALHILRLLFQIVLIYWAWVYTKDDQSSLRSR